MEPLDIDGAYLYTPLIFPDHRGTFHESYRSAELTAFTGQPMPVAQVNCVVSGRGALCGVHFCDAPPRRPGPRQPWFGTGPRHRVNRGGTGSDGWGITSGVIDRWFTARQSEGVGARAGALRPVDRLSGSDVRTL
ncbi:hypothetical protein DY245_20545 [Streptomyces inhibens]|uniref:Uncharacterized protein n=1 Tax=Streptomyces inhibens TaxID=2293571 RepID=A0A371Q1H2_STRIH|nr:hypothetical protein DY245_20545 [Streptomyces inhibens]